MHIITAFANESGIVLRQLKVGGKTNEITAIPELLDLINFEGATVMTDTMGCQKKVVEKIVDKKARYVLGLKGNQTTFHNDVPLLFKDNAKNVIFMIY